jgi:hypothetical protein
LILPLLIYQYFFFIFFHVISKLISINIIWNILIIKQNKLRCLEDNGYDMMGWELEMKLLGDLIEIYMINNYALIEIYNVLQKKYNVPALLNNYCSCSLTDYYFEIL